MEINELSYEKALKKLEDTLKELENVDCSLEDSLDKYKMGIKLYKHCNNLLSKAEAEIKIVLEDEEGSLKQSDFIREVEKDY